MLKNISESALLHSHLYTVPYLLLEIEATSFLDAKTLPVPGGFSKLCELACLII